MSDKEAFWRSSRNHLAVFYSPTHKSSKKSIWARYKVVSNGAKGLSMKLAHKGVRRVTQMRTRGRVNPKVWITSTIFMVDPKTNETHCNSIDLSFSLYSVFLYNTTLSFNLGHNRFCPRARPVHSLRKNEREQSCTVACSRRPDTARCDQSTTGLSTIPDAPSHYPLTSQNHM